MYRAKLASIQKENQLFRERMERQVQSLLASRQQVSTFEEEIMHLNDPAQRNPLLIGSQDH